MGQFNAPSVPGSVISYATPAPYAAVEAWRDGPLLVCRTQAMLPERCVKCGGTEDCRRIRRKMNWLDPAWTALLLLGVVPYGIVALCLQKKARVEMSLCRVHRRARARQVWIAAGIAILGAAVLVGSIILIGSPAYRSSVLPGLGVMAAVVLMLFGAIWGAVRVPVVKPKRIDAHFCWLKGAGAGFLDTLTHVQ